MTLQWVAALLAPAICNFGPPYGFFVGQHIVAVTMRKATKKRTPKGAAPGTGAAA
jgi:hypothetical protein